MFLLYWLLVKAFCYVIHKQLIFIIHLFVIVEQTKFLWITNYNFVLFNKTLFVKLFYNMHALYRSIFLFPSYKLQYWLLGGDLWKSETKSTCHSFLLKIHYLHFRFVCILFLPLLNYFSIFGFLFETICRQIECLLECIEHAYIHTHTRNVYISKWKWAVCISVTHRIQ